MNLSQDGQQINLNFNSLYKLIIHCIGYYHILIDSEPYQYVKHQNFNGGSDMKILISKKKLIKEYNIYAHFYQITSGNEIVADCRSILEVFNKNYAISKITDLINCSPDVLFIMMNPGLCASEAINCDEQINVNNFKMDFLNKKFIKATIDNTLQRVMTVSFRKGWNHLRVINLSDIRFKKDMRFNDILDGFETKTNSSIHSIFHPNRHDELIHSISGYENCKIILAWGVGKYLDKYIDYVSKIIDCKKCYGIKNSNGRYYHPLGSEISWVGEILAQLNN